MQLVEIDYLDTTTDEIQHTPSEERIIQYGVPQGSILGPLFSIRLTLFADDTTIPITGKNVNELAFNLDTINSIISWFDKNRLIINKNKLLAFGFHHKWNKNIVFPDITLKDGQITYASETKFLGIWLNQNLNWDLHVENLSKG
jgi:hypothetical protein